MSINDPQDQIMIRFQDRLDREFSITGRPNEFISSVLHRNHIPIDSVMVKRDGRVVDDWLEKLDPGHEYLVEMVRAYHLPDFLSLLRLWDKPRDRWKEELQGGDSYYTRRFFWHNQSDGDYEATQTTFNQDQFVQYLDRTFVEGIRLKNLIEDHDSVALAMSGGRDSLSLGYFLNRNKEQLPIFSIHSIHVGAFAKPKDTHFAEQIAQRFGYKHRYVSDEEVRQIFRLRKTPQEILEIIKYKFNKGYSIACVHAIMRGAVEHQTRAMGIKKIAYGLMCEDLMASIVKSKFIGFPFYGPYKKQFGDLQLIYPLWPITKKELTLYLEAIVPEHSTQGSPTEFDRGALSRDIFYFIADTLETILPGAAMQLFAAHENAVKHYIKPMKHHVCENCGSIFSNTESYHKELLDKMQFIDPTVCELCNLLEELHLLKD